MVLICTLPLHGFQTLTQHPPLWQWIIKTGSETAEKHLWSLLSLSLSSVSMNKLVWVIQHVTRELNAMFYKSLQVFLLLLSSHCRHVRTYCIIRRGLYLRLGVICLAGQDAEVPWGSDGHQALDIFDKLLVVFGVPEYNTVLLPLWLCVGIHHCAATVAPLLRDIKELVRFTLCAGLRNSGKKYDQTKDMFLQMTKHFFRQILQARCCLCSSTEHRRLLHKTTTIWLVCMHSLTHTYVKEKINGPKNL